MRHRGRHIVAWMVTGGIAGAMVGWMRTVYTREYPGHELLADLPGLLLKAWPILVVAAVTTIVLEGLRRLHGWASRKD